MRDHNLFDTLYAGNTSPEETRKECDFIEHFIPLESHPALLDMACETGRISLELGTRGYTITGTDLDRNALQVARSRAAERDLSVRFIEGDLRHLTMIDERFDGIVLFWQSFGFFEWSAQAGLFNEFRRLLRPGARLILGLYNRLHFMRGVPPTTDSPVIELTGRSIGGEIHGFLGYEEDLRFEKGGASELFDPHLFSPSEITGIAANHGFRLLASCSEFSISEPATAEHQRMQLVFERID